jgi:hypothetical protein
VVQEGRGCWTAPDLTCWMSINLLNLDLQGTPPDLSVARRRRRGSPNPRADARSLDGRWSRGGGRHPYHGLTRLLGAGQGAEDRQPIDSRI